MKKFSYCTNCTSAKARHLEPMVDNAKEITFKTFMKHVDLDEMRGIFQMYDWGRSGGLKMKDDFMVSYYKSKYRGKPCYYVEHSCIEYIFC